MSAPSDPNDVPPMTLPEMPLKTFKILFGSLFSPDFYFRIKRLLQR
jgi:hypothetical protein